MTNCLTCQFLARRDNNQAPLWDNIYRTANWDLVHSYNTSLPGWLVLIPRRHVESIANLTPDEYNTLGPLLHHTSQALKTNTNCRKTYIVQFADHPQHPHVHFHIIPVMNDQPDTHRGPNIFNYLRTPQTEHLQPPAMNDIANQIRAYLTTAYPQPTPPSRHLNWPHCYNARDLGGLPTTNNHTTRWAALVRSDILTRLDDAGRQALDQYGIRTIIDIRSHRELNKIPSPYHDHPTITFHHLPVEDQDTNSQAILATAQDHHQVYRLIIDHFPHNLVTILRALITAPPGGILIHCHAGKDRTGLVTALLLTTLGLTPHTIATDYVLSQQSLWPLYQKMIADKGPDNITFWQKPLTPPELILATLDHITTTYDSIPNYLTQHGLTPTEQQQLRHRFLI
ncbi:MAG TPA: tyrosine-protein phosphatase [Anaerolineae bacterium]|nr:tyrosine-protein phosphatase [Anaerolineae bacterium]